jgi:hypothetical protein
MLKRWLLAAIFGLVLILSFARGVILRDPVLVHDKAVAFCYT